MMALDPFDLTPLSIRRQQAAMAAISRYLVFALILSGFLSSLLISRWQHRERQAIAMKKLMEQALPIRDKRLESLRLQQGNQQLQRIVDAVASAQPRDSLLQSFAAATEGALEAGLTPRQLHIRLAIEPPNESSMPSWAIPAMKMTLESDTDTPAIRAHEAISKEDRFTDMKTQGLSRIGEITRTDLVGMPVAEVLLP
ncbi:MAG: hypothetical protein ACO1RT_04980 [Planctomycetaceae bacterium]